MYETSNSSRSGRPRSAIVATALMLAATTTLAFWLSKSRGLGEVVAGEDWAITFRPPHGWVSQGWQDLSFGERAVFAPEGQARAAERWSLSVSRIPSQDEISLERLELMAGVSHLGAGMMEAHSVSLGPLPGFRYANVQGGRITHVGLHTTKEERSEAYVFILQHEPPNRQRDYALAEAVARSVEFAPVSATDSAGGSPSTDRG